MAKQTPIEKYLMTSESKALIVLFWLLRNRDSEGVIHTTLDLTAKECGVTKVTVNRVFQKLYDAEFLEKVRNGQYKLNNV